MLIKLYITGNGPLKKGLHFSLITSYFEKVGNINSITIKVTTIRYRRDWKGLQNVTVEIVTYITPNHTFSEKTYEHVKNSSYLAKEYMKLNER